MGRSEDGRSHLANSQGSEQSEPECPASEQIILEQLLIEVCVSQGPTF